MYSFWHTLRKPILALAPMEGYTDTAFRRICRAQGADVVYTEFISSDAIARRAPAALRKLSFHESEQPVVCQIFGNDVAAFVSAAREVQARGFAGIDVNLGCPARKIVAKGSGVALMRNPEFARTLVSSIIDKVTIPVSIKIRTSIRAGYKGNDGQPSRHTALDLLAALHDIPIAAIMVHGRSFEEGFSGTLDVDMVRAVKQSTDAIVLANGGIHAPEDARAACEATGADGVGIARGCIGSPWLFRMTRASFSGKTPVAPSGHERLAVIQQHLGYMIDYGGSRGMLEFRKHLVRYLRGFDGASDARARAVRAESADEVLRIIADTAAQQEEWASV